VDARELHKALRVVARVLANGEATHRVGSANHWTRLSPREHTRRAMVHGERFILGVLVDHDDTDELAHAATRLLLALELREREQREQLDRASDLQLKARDLKVTLQSRSNGAK
jgi:hypothetical protein